MKRSNKNEKLENFLTDLQRLTIVHETDHGGSYYRFASGTSSPVANLDEEAAPPPKKDTSKGDATKNDAKATDSKDSKEKVLDGDKAMSEQHGAGDAHEAQNARQNAPVNMADPKASRDAQNENRTQRAQQDNQYRQSNNQYGNANQISRDVQTSKPAQQHPTQQFYTKQIANQPDRQAKASQRSLHHPQLDMDLAPPISDDDASSGEHTKVGE